MKKVIPFMILLLLIISACSNDSKKGDASSADEDTPETITYDSENGPVEVPADPQRVIVLSQFAGNVMALDVPLVGVDSFSKMNPRFEDKLGNVEEVSDDNLEKIIELNPDLIIGSSTIKNREKLEKIAPTVTYTYDKVDYLTQHLEIGKLLNKEKEAQQWIDDFKKRSKAAGEAIRKEIGEDATVTVIENFDKQIYVFGNNWGRGTEILYQEMKLKMPKKVEEMALKDGFYALSLEVLPEYAGDYVIFSKSPDTDNAFMDTETYQNIPAVKNNQVFEVNAKAFYFNDPLTLDYQLEFFKDSFLGN